MPTSKTENLAYSGTEDLTCLDDVQTAFIISLHCLLLVGIWDMSVGRQKTQLFITRGEYSLHYTRDGGMRKIFRFFCLLPTVRSTRIILRESAF